MTEKIEGGAKRASGSHTISLYLLIIPVVLFIGGWATIQQVDSRGLAFFNTGKQISEELDDLARAAKGRNSGAFGAFFDANYRGRGLGWSALRPVDSKDGIERLAFTPKPDELNRAISLADWLDYFCSFDTLESVGFHIHRLEEWKDPAHVKATIRFETIGVPHGKPLAGIDRGYIEMTFAKAESGFVITSAALTEGERIIAGRDQFVNVAHAAGIDFRNRYYPPFINSPLKFGMIRYGPGGITAVDYDNDGLYDLFIPDGVESKLFRNKGDGTFEDVTQKAGLAGLDGASVAVFADYDNDGYKDLFVSRTFKPNQLFHNNRDGTFTDVTAKSGIGDDCCTTVASWADYDNDGFLDLYVGRYLDPRTAIPTTFYARNGEPNQLYHNNGDGTFTNVTARAGVGDTGLCLGTVFGDYDNDGWPDLYVVNDFGRKTLYRNNRDGTFSDVTVKSGTLDYGAGMSASFADYDNDGKLDIYATNIRSEHAWYAAPPTVNRYMLNSWREGVWKTDMPLYMQIFRQSGFRFNEVFQQMASGNTLLHNKGDGTFDDVTWKAGANPVGWYWGASFADFDNDGWLDIYAADGWVFNDKDTEIELDFLNNVVTRQDTYKTGLFFDPAYFGRRSWHGWERNRLLRNNGDGTFSEIGRAAGADLMINSRGVAVADFWNRGVMDIAVSSSGNRHALLRNEVDSHRNWLQVELVGVKSNRDAVGARVSVVVGGKPQMREVTLGDGYGSQNSLRQHFGLGDASAVDTLTVRWPRSGIVQTFHNVAADRIIEITEGRNDLVEKHYKRLP